MPDCPLCQRTLPDDQFIWGDRLCLSCTAHYKQCSKCKQIKEYSHFYTKNAKSLQRSAAKGLQPGERPQYVSHCKECCRSKVQDYRVRHPYQSVKKQKAKSVETCLFCRKNPTPALLCETCNSALGQLVHALSKVSLGGA